MTLLNPALRQTIFCTFVIVIFVLTIAGIGFAGKRNTYGIYYSGNINNTDLPKRIDQDFQTEVILEYFRLRLEEMPKPEQNLTVRFKTQKCDHYYFKTFRKTSDHFFLMPAYFDYQISSVIIKNSNQPGLLFFGRNLNEQDTIEITQCDSNWMVQFGHE